MNGTAAGVVLLGIAVAGGVHMTRTRRGVTKRDRIAERDHRKAWERAAAFYIEQLKEADREHMDTRRKVLHLQEMVDFYRANLEFETNELTKALVRERAIRGGLRRCMRRLKERAA